MFQQVIVMGRLGKEPDVRSTQSGRSVTSFNVAATRSWTANGERQERTIWFRVSVWDKQADVCARFLHKGSQVHVLGELEEPHVYTDKDGTARASLEITARNVTFIGGRDEGGLAPEGEARAAAPLSEDVPF